VSNFTEDENTIAENCLLSYEINKKAMTALSKSVASGNQKRDSDKKSEKSRAATNMTQGTMYTENMRMNTVEDKTRVNQ
jgi:hypothetical protein